MISRIFRYFFGKKRPIKYEDAFTVTITNDFVRMEHHDFKPEEILWKDIIEIRLVNTDEGPSYPDIWLALIGRESCCHIPQEATGFTQVYDIVSKYEGFDFENVTKSMCSTSNEQFLLWRKAAA